MAKRQRHEAHQGPNHTSEELSGGKKPVSLHPLNKDIPLAGQTSVMKHPEGKPWLRHLEADRNKAPQKKSKEK